MKCCAACFADPVLAASIGNTGDIGCCDSCGREDVLVVDAESLRDYFEPVVGLYGPNEDGKPLHELLQDDWGIFAIDDGTARESLLSAIVADLGIPAGRYGLGYEQGEDPLALWEIFSKELKYENRFLPASTPDTQIFGDFAEQFGLVWPAGSVALFRARINEDGHQFTPDEMLKPPANLVTNGRANPLGIPYLYVASDSDTAITEVRGHKGDHVTVVTFSIEEELSLYDLRTPRVTVSPFRQLDDVARLHKHLPYFELLGDELSKPITPRRANLDYLPSQYLCEVIKQTGLHGILYRSSIAKGFNCVVFADDRLRTGEMHEHEVVEMSYSTQLVREL
jgi:hypothetical protein